MDGGASGGARGILRNSAVLFVAKILERAVGFVIALLVAAHLGVDGLGVYSAAWAIYALIAIAGEAGTTNYLVREISRDPSRTASYAVHLSVVGVALAVVLIAGAWVVVPHIGYSAELEASVAVVLFAILPKVLNSVQEAVFVAHGRVAYETLTRMCSSTTYVGVAAWMLAHDAGVSKVLSAFVVAEYIVTIVYFVLINRFIARLRLHFRWALARRLLVEMKAYTASTAIAALFARPEILLLSVLATEREIGLYSAGMRIAELPLLVSEVLMINVFPVLSRAYGTAEALFARWQVAAARAVFAVSLPIAACYLAAAPAIIGLLFGADFTEAVPVLRMLAFGLVFMSINGVLWRSLAARGRQGTNVGVQCVTLTLRLGAGFALIGPLGAIGAALANVSSTTLHSVLLSRAVARSGAPAPLVQAGWRFALAALATALAIWGLDAWLPGLAALVVGALVYPVAALAVGAITPADRRLLHELRRPVTATTPHPAES